LAPDIVEAIIDGRQGHAMTVQTLTKPFPVEWPVQRDYLDASATQPAKNRKEHQIQAVKRATPKVAQTVR